MHELHTLITQSVHTWKQQGREGIYPETKHLLRYITQVGYLRLPQVEALETYIYLKEILNNLPTSKLVRAIYNHNEADILESLNLSQGQLLEYLKSADKSSYIDVILNDRYGSSDYSNYVFSLAMGSGKTILMAALIAYDFILSYHHPTDRRFGKNVLVFAPDTTIIDSLREIKEFDYARVVPKEYMSILLNLKFHYLESIDTPLNPIGNYNIIVSNSQKIILKTQRKLSQVENLFKNESALSNKTKANKRLIAIESLSDLMIFVDEAHHSYGKNLEGELKKTRETINYLHTEGKTPLTNVVNMTGTPYINNRLISDVVYTYGLKEGIAMGILKPVQFYEYPVVRDDEFITDVVKRYLSNYSSVQVEGMTPKIAFYSPSIEVLQTELRPFLEKLLRSLDIPLDTILEYHINKNDEKEAFRRLDTIESTKQFILLVNKGTEGWNCRSLVACAMYRNLGSTIFLLQSSTRCLRACGGATANIFLSSENAKILDTELRKNYNISMSDLDKEENKKLTYELKVIKDKKIKVKRRVRQLVARKAVDLTHFKITLPTGTFVDTQVKVGDKGLNSKSGHQHSSYVEMDNGVARWHSYHEIISHLSTHTHIPCLDLVTILTNNIGPSQQVVKYLNRGADVYDFISNQLVTKLFTYTLVEDEIEEEIHLSKRFPFSVHVDTSKKALVVSRDAHKLGFHIDPYVFDSDDERSLFVYLLDRLDNDEVIADLYFTGGVHDTIHNDFSFEYWSPESEGYRRYFPDFLVETSKGRYIVVEVKGSDKEADYRANKKSYTGNRDDLHNEVFAKEIGFNEFTRINPSFEYHLIFNAGLRQRQEELRSTITQT